MTNKELLNERIEKSGMKKSYIAKVIGMSPGSLSRKIANQRDFKASEINALCKLLGIEAPEEKEAIFFATKVA